MALPDTNLQWPPIQMMHAYSKMAEWAAWYSGDPNRIMAVYEMNQAANASSVPWWRFWSRARQGASGAQRALIHLPIAGDLAATSGALLFGEPPSIRVRAAHEADEPDEQCADCQGPAPAGHLGDHMQPDPLTGLMGSTPKKPLIGKKPDTPEAKTEERLLQIIEEGGVYSRLIEAAESSAALGGVYIYPVWDKDLRDFPLMAVAQSDMAVPEFKFGILTAVTFHRTVQADGNRILRLLERHEVEGTGDSRKAVVLSGLYQGTEDRLGVQVGLGVGDYQGTAVPEARVELPFPDLDVEYVPNIKPNRLWRAEHLGVSDYQGAETLLDALDETYASWMRDIRLAKARILVPREYLRPDADGNAAFDLDQEIYVGMDMEPGLSQDARSMLAHQFEIRYKEHQETARDLIDRIVSNAGYSPSTLGGRDTVTGTGTALRIGEHKTLLTIKRKSAWWRTAIANTLYRMLLIDADVFASGITPVRPTVDISDSIIDNPLELAQTAMALKTAGAASVETMVRLNHPDWSSEEVLAEVDKIKADTPAPEPPAFGGPGKGTFGAPPGKPPTDPAATGNLPTKEPAKGPAPTNQPPPQVGAKPK